MSVQFEAHALLRAAYDASYRFPAGFPGFSAQFTFTQDDASADGSVRVRSPRDLETSVTTNDEAVQWIERELASITGHRWPTPYEEADGRWQVELDPDDGHPAGRLIRILDDPYDSSYRLRDGRISQINRRMGPMRFTITIQTHTSVDDKHLPSEFSVAYWHAETGRLTQADVYSDRYVLVDGVYLPSLRRVVTANDAGLTARQIVLTGHELFEGTGIMEPVAIERSATRAG